jgi:hypothetical protein
MKYLIFMSKRFTIFFIVYLFCTSCLNVNKTANLYKVKILSMDSLSLTQDFLITSIYLKDTIKIVSSRKYEVLGEKIIIGKSYKMDLQELHRYKTNDSIAIELYGKNWCIDGRLVFVANQKVFVAKNLKGLFIQKKVGAI